MLVPLIENGGDAWIDDVLKDYLSFTDDAEFDALLLGCTHYIHLKDRVRAAYPFDVIAQDEIIPSKLDQYLKKHPEVLDNMSKNSFIDFYVTDLTDDYADNASALFGQNVDVKLLEGVHG